MTISIVFNQGLLLWFIWGYIVLSGLVSFWNALTVDKENLIHALLGVGFFIVALLVMIL